MALTRHARQAAERLLAGNARTVRKLMLATGMKASEWKDVRKILQWKS